MRLSTPGKNETVLNKLTGSVQQWRTRQGNHLSINLDMYVALPQQTLQAHVVAAARIRVPKDYL